jgi:hypothetical protein
MIEFRQGIDYPISRLLAEGLRPGLALRAGRNFEELLPESLQGTGTLAQSEPIRT